MPGDGLPAVPRAAFVAPAPTAIVPYRWGGPDAERSAARVRARGGCRGLFVHRPRRGTPRCAPQGLHQQALAGIVDVSRRVKMLFDRRKAFACLARPNQLATEARAVAGSISPAARRRCSAGSRRHSRRTLRRRTRMRPSP